MDTYKDYQEYIKENTHLLDVVKDNAPSVYLIVEDLIEVLDYVASEKEKGSKLESELLELFDIGYDYLSTFVEEIDYIFKDYLKSDKNKLAKYNNIITYWFYFNDLKIYLEYDKHQKDVKLLEDILNEIDDILKNQKELDNNYIQKYEESINILDSHAEHKPVFYIYGSVKEELNL